ncbi:hypothetical protein VIBNISFn27_710026 [Vibrio nigripulchritudo SFn27]|uniref:Uncharacterized protein n=1 Tax=Vibrio nigripulchritudo TaxID=28173 RepID=U4KIT3_9VIBR|nr:hypothetical protein VIBNIBLFn1_300009 [Vibrio nigripulchritudo BLFn1]CCN90385.1 hypothetical protein VIBNISFn27_710026 [Vibrio nigripulchritudo SFn27]CCN93841.1 hypothetical protein VIBNIENn2_310104 [Vibrio nigripulchritudo ENn2]CCO42869.1 hypothetical protein VIBNISFn135_870102 [Vibrio nigripulchritudo SFn135]CCO55657.1 hypothetical protein VIBNIWn13_870104 [Vibrio nigripulchritudo Wn13]CCO61230.1 hypothetical protein VIBNI_B1479 [Vibrio nigripulchritudo]
MKSDSNKKPLFNPNYYTVIESNKARWMFLIAFIVALFVIKLNF